MKISMKLLVAALLLFSFAAHSQVITLTAQATTGDESVTPVLTWSTTPAATSCTATGGWSGTKAAAGSETLAAITSDATYNLECVWQDTRATVRWTPPTTNTNGTTYTDPAGFVLSYSTLPTALGNEIRITDSTATSHVVAPLAPGRYYFGVQAENQRGLRSDMSDIVSKLIGTTNQVRSVGITVNPRPARATNISVE